MSREEETRRTGGRGQTREKAPEKDEEYEGAQRGKERHRKERHQRQRASGEGYGCIRDGITREKTSLEGWPPLPLFEPSPLARKLLAFPRTETKNVALPRANSRAFVLLARVVIRGLLAAFCPMPEVSEL